MIFLYEGIVVSICIFEFLNSFCVNKNESRSQYKINYECWVSEVCWDQVKEIEIRKNRGNL